MDRFVVGSGRCGSTLLSRMLAESPEVLCLSEFFNGLDMTRRFGPEPATGEELAWLVSLEHPFLSLVLQRGYPVPEIVYPFGRPGARHRRGEGLPYLLGACLPRIADDPDALFDELVAFARKRPRASLAEHYRALFEWLLGRTGRRVWVERSGSSIDYLASLHELFPEARFVHLHRDGPEAALSMREHHAFRLAVGMTVRVREHGARSLEALGELSGREGDRIDGILASRPDAALFGRFWSGQIERGLAAARALPPGRLLEVRFEDLLADPGATLRRIAAFFELDAGGGSSPGRGPEGAPDAQDWVERAAALVRGVPPPPGPRSARRRARAPRRRLRPGHAAAREALIAGLRPRPAAPARCRGIPGLGPGEWERPLGSQTTQAKERLRVSPRSRCPSEAARRRPPGATRPRSCPPGSARRPRGRAG